MLVLLAAGSMRPDRHDLATDIAHNLVSTPVSPGDSLISEASAAAGPPLALVVGSLLRIPHDSGTASASLLILVERHDDMGDSCLEHVSNHPRWEAQEP